MSAVRGQTLVLRPDWVVLESRDGPVPTRELEVVVQGDSIQAVRARTCSRDQCIELPGQLLLPGFISSHTHVLAGAAARGLREGFDEPVRWSTSDAASALLPMEIIEELSDEELDTLTAAGLLEIVRGGCTTQVEMASTLRQAQSYVRVAGQLRTRGYVGSMLPSLHRLVPIWRQLGDPSAKTCERETQAEIQAGSAMLGELSRAGNALVQPMLAISLSAAHSLETLGAISKASEALDCPVQLHIQSGELGATSESEVSLLERAGILVRPVIGAHLLGVSRPEDFGILASRPFTFAHCPTGGGVASNPAGQPYPEALAHGVNTALGLDAHSKDYVENIKLAVIQGVARHQLGATSGPSRRPTILDAIASSTSAPARGLGRNDLGRIEPGAKADLCAIAIDPPGRGLGASPPSPLSYLLYSSASSVTNVMTNGVWHVRNNVSQIGNEARVFQERTRIVARLWKRLTDVGFAEVRVRSAAT